MKLSTTILLLFIILSTSLLAQKESKKKNTERINLYLEQGDSLSNVEKDNDKARVLYKKAMEIDSQNAVAYHKLGRSFLDDYFSNNAPDTYLDSTVFYENRARLIDPKYVSAYWNEVLAYRLKWRHGMSRKVIMEALLHLPENPEILMLAGRNYFDTGNPGLALPYLEKSIEIGGNNTPGVSYRFAGWCWFYLENHEKQLEYFNKFREIDSKSLMGIAGQVHSYTGLKNFGKATELAKQIKKKNPDYRYPAYLEAYIGETLLFGKKFDEAITY